MKVARDVLGTGRLPSEFIDIFNISDPYENISSTNKLLIGFIEGYDGHYIEDGCEWVIEEV